MNIRLTSTSAKKEMKLLLGTFEDMYELAGKHKKVFFADLLEEDWLVNATHGISGDYANDLSNFRYYFELIYLGISCNCIFILEDKSLLKAFQNNFGFFNTECTLFLPRYNAVCRVSLGGSIYLQMEIDSRLYKVDKYSLIHLIWISPKMDRVHIFVAAEEIKAGHYHINGADIEFAD
ncbi:MAG: hypothetical protein NUV82_04360 [Candidatus Komeilibacteria bacterium]|nr:hypothetical protein [Candidatus Komeilibacteria bacterium]